MGHDISAFKASDKDRGDEIAYIRFSAGDAAAREFYKALGAQDCDCGCSGCGGNLTFTAEQIKTALQLSPWVEGDNRQREFFQRCIDESVGEDVVIGFY